MTAAKSPEFPTNYQALLDSGWKTRTVKEEMKANLISMLESGEDPFALQYYYPKL